VRVAVSDVFPQLPTVSIGVTMAQRFVIDDIVRRQYRRFKVVGTQFNARLLPTTKNNADYNSYRRGCRIRPAVQRLLETTGIDLSGGGGIPELVRFQEHFRDYKITVYQGLNCEDKMFEGRVEDASKKRINLLYDDVERHYHVITNLTGAMARKFVCKGCNKACTSDVMHACDQTCSDCMNVPPCAFSDVRIPCAECNRHFRSRTCYANHKQQSTSNRKSVCERKRRCATCGGLVTGAKHECYKRFCENCKQNRDVNHVLHETPEGLAACRRR